MAPNLQIMQEEIESTKKGIISAYNEKTDSKIFRNIYGTFTALTGTLTTIGLTHASGLEEILGAAILGGGITGISAYATNKEHKKMKKQESSLNYLHGKLDELKEEYASIIEKAKETYSTYKGKIENKLETTKAS